MKRLCCNCVSFVIAFIFISRILTTSADNCRLEDTTIKLNLAIPTDEFMEKANRRNLNITEQNFETVVSAFKDLAYNSIDQLVENNFLNFIVVLLEIDDASVQIQAANAFTIITSGNMNGTIKTVVDAGALPVLISRLSSNNQPILEKILLTLGDIAMENAYYRDLCIEAGIIDPLLDLIHPDVPFSVLRKIIRVIACLCHAKDQPIPIELIKQVLPTLHQLIQREDPEIPIELVLTLFQIAEQGTEQVQMIIDANIVPRIVSLLNHKSSDIVQLTLKLLEKIVIEAYVQLQPFFDDKIMELTFKLLDHSDKAVGMEAVHFFSQIMSANTNQTVLLFNTDFLPLIAELLKQRDQRKEMALTISDLAIYESDHQIQQILRKGIIGYLCGSLELDDKETRLAALEGLNIVLTKWPRQKRSILRQIIKNKGIQKLERLENHVDLDTSMFAIDILDTLFSAKKKERTNRTDNVFQMIMLPFKEFLNAVLSWLFEFVLYAKLIKQDRCN